MDKGIKKILSGMLGIILAITMTSCDKGEDQEAGKDRLLTGYIQNEINLEDIQLIHDLKLDNDNVVNLVYEDEYGDIKIYDSLDNGNEWNEKKQKLLKEDREYRYPILLLEDNSLYTYSRKKEDVNNSNKEFEDIIISKDGVEIQFEINKEAQEIKIGKNGNILAYNTDTIFEYDRKNAKLKNKYLVDDTIINLCTNSKYLFIQGSESILKISLENEKKIENLKVLEELVDFNSFIYPSNNDKYLYILNKSGIYMYNIYTNEVNQILDGLSYMMGDNSKSIRNFIEIDQDTFLVVYYDDIECKYKLYRYQYSEQVANETVKELEVYSLYENIFLQEIINKYQSINTKIKVKYKIGIETGSAITENDAIKTLNTELMSDNAPDIVFLDGLEYENYIEKGIFENISDTIEQSSEKFFDNILKPYYDENEIYAIPLTFKIPVILGEKNEIEQINNLLGLTSMSDNDSKRILNVYAPRDIINLMFYTSSSQIVKEKTLDLDNLEVFLKSVKRIYNNEKNKISSEEYDGYEEYTNNLSVEEVERISQDMYTEKNIDPIMIYAPEYSSTNIGYISSIYDVSNIYSVKVDNDKISYNVFEDNGKKLFLPKNIISISTNSNNKELAKEFVTWAISNEGQEVSKKVGLPINRQALSSIYNNKDADESLGISAIGGDDFRKEIEKKWTNENEYSILLQNIEKLETPININKYILNVIINIGDKYIKDELSIDEAIDDILKEVKIYLLE